MEAFTLLGYWRTARDHPTFTARAAASTRYSHYGEDGPYFDLEFSIANEDGDGEAAAHELVNAKTPKDTESESGSSIEDFSESEDDDEEKLQFDLTDCRNGAGQNFTANSLKTEADDGSSGKYFTAELKDTDESKLPKELVRKYFKMLKPLCTFNNLGLKVVRKHLGKSRSTSAAAVVSPRWQVAPDNRRCDSPVELQDGIQGAILHCKRSFFNASREGESCVLTRSASDPSYDKSVIMPTGSSAAAALYSGDAIEIEFN